jgi:hypothetical protein
MKWIITPEFAALLAPVLDSEGELVKRSGTTVTRHRVAGRVFYVKCYHHGVHPLAPIKYSVRAPKSRREWRRAVQLLAHGVPVVPHLAHGEQWVWRGLLKSVLITEGPSGYAPLAEAANLQAPELQHAFGRFVRQLHELGVLQPDFHPHNLLYSPHDRMFCLMDLDKVRLSRGLNKECRAENLAMLQAWTLITPSFHDGYGALPEPAAEIARRAAAVRRRYQAGWARRCLRHAHEIEVVRVGDLRWLVRRTAHTSRLNEVLARPDATSAGNNYIIERREFSFHAARRAYRRAFYQELLGDTGLRPVAVGEKRWLGLCVCDYFVAERLESRQPRRKDIQ